MSSWFSKHLEVTPVHLTYLLISTFLLLYALLSHPIRNTLHLSEPPLATLVGIAFGPRGAAFLNPNRWGIEDNVTQEATRVIVGLQVFSVGVELPKNYLFKRSHAVSIGMLLGPVMAFSWLITAAFVYLVLRPPFATALIISACLAPTDPVLAASVLAESRFARRVPARIRHLLSCESGCNDGVSFPFIYIGISVTVAHSAASAAKEWFLGTILWQCALGTLLGLVIGKAFNLAIRYSSRKQNISPPAFLVFYFLLALFSVGVGSTLGVDDFLVAFGAGYGFAYDGWFARKTRATHLPQILDLLLNSTMFIYFGTIIPWHLFSASSSLNPIPNMHPWKLVVLLILIILFRRIPPLLALKPLIPVIRTYTEALFAGHFGPMGLGALFLAIEARAMLETGTSLPLKHPDPKDILNGGGAMNKEEARMRYIEVETIWAVVCFIILGSVMIHGVSVALISVGDSLRRRWIGRKDEKTKDNSRDTHGASTGGRGGLLGLGERLLPQGLGTETDGLGGMIHEPIVGIDVEEAGSHNEDDDDHNDSESSSFSEDEDIMGSSKRKSERDGDDREHGDHGQDHGREGGRRGEGRIRL